MGAWSQRAKELKLGYGTDEGVGRGPADQRDALEKVERYVGDREARRRHAGVWAASAPPGEGLDDGFFFQPTIFTGVKRRHAHGAREEIFGPVLSVIRVATPTRRSG